ncbi:MAG: UDP-N-acetylmuramate:L-alanyl-gamma-D-glutamyl-meso-diaminopimelate ligase [Mariprofundaceae bacterium]|nr:UDP-N-acetylmuramate:L-alanyl-gamma-D-glutamyl-meso-diaminopimelate ligase [Mariprofundaceae bacterium]
MAKEGSNITPLFHPHQAAVPHIHIIGVCGTAMAAIAVLAQEKGWRVTGSDAAVYPPMSDILAKAGIAVLPFAASNLVPAPDLCLIGNAISRGNNEVEVILNESLAYTSGAAFIGDYIVPKRHTVVVAGTHGKTSTASLMAYVLANAGENIGFMIGGVPEDFSIGARLGHHESPFVIEGDEYDTALFDKRSKFLHYHARTLILNNLEYDHADIFPDLAAIQVQFEHLLRTVPAAGSIIVNADDANLAAVLAEGCWTPCVSFSHRANKLATAWQWQADTADGRSFTLWHHGVVVIQEQWQMIGQHQVANACAVAAAAHGMGIELSMIAAAFRQFKGVRRRMSLVNTVNGIRLFDDFAHHPTAIAGIVCAAKAAMQGKGKLWVILEPRSNTMCCGIHQQALIACFAAADHVLCLPPAKRGKNDEDLLDVDRLCHDIGKKAMVINSHAVLAEAFAGKIQAGDDVIILSNASVTALHETLNTVRSKV